MTKENTTKINTVAKSNQADIEHSVVITDDKENTSTINTAVNN